MTKPIRRTTLEDCRKICGQRLRQAMEMRKTTVPELGKTTGIPLPSLYLYMTCKNTPPLDRLILLAGELKVSVDWLIGNEPAELTGRWDLYNGTGMTAIYRCSQCGNKTGPGLKNRNYCEVCGSRNVRWAVRGKPGRKKEEA